MKERPPDRLPLRRVPGWQFFNENRVSGVWDAVRPGGIDALSPESRKVAEWFIEMLKGRRRVVDVGCGVGFPGLYVAKHVGELIGVDAAPNMISKARENARESNVKNASFEVGLAEGLPFADGEFDGALLCGLLESMDWESVGRAVPEARRVLSRGGRVAVLDQDWRDVLGSKPREQGRITQREGNLILRIVERMSSPALEKTTWYQIDPNSGTGPRMKEELGGEARVATKMGHTDVGPGDAIDAWYDEWAQFDADTLKDLLTSYGFRNVSVNSTRTWDQQILYLTATR